MGLYANIHRNSYQDSVKLMQVSERIKTLPGIRKAFAIMGTDANKATLARSGFDLSLMADATPSDILFLVDAQTEEAAQKAFEQFETLVAEVRQEEAVAGRRARSIKSARAMLPQASIALISVPGEFAAYEARKALREGLHVHLFSDNVSIEEEIALKALGERLGLLVMGPGCGTSIIGGTPIGFANVIRRGPIGVIGAAGTGIQQVTVLIDHYGSGISHAIGVGGRDLTDAVGGASTLLAFDMLEQDEQTEVIVLVGKVPGPRTVAAVADRVARCSKPVVSAFLGVMSQDLPAAGVAAWDLDAAARRAVEMATQSTLAFDRAEVSAEALRLSLADRLDRAPRSRIRVRGLYTGGSLADEAMVIMRKTLGTVFSNIDPDPAFRVPGKQIIHEHAIIDMGDDEFTVGRPHPMIDPSYRAERIIEEWQQEDTAVILCDVVLGYGSHQNPAQAVADAVHAARRMHGDAVTVIASVIGTERDPQQLSRQESILKDAGILVFSSNASAARAACAAVRLYAERR